MTTELARTSPARALATGREKGTGGKTGGSSGDTIRNSEKLSMVSLRQVSFGKEEET